MIRNLTCLLVAACSFVLFAQAHAASQIETAVLLSALGAKGDGASDDSHAFQAGADLSASKPGMLLAGEPGKTYVLKSGISLRGDFHLDLNGATLMPTGLVSNLFYRPAPTTTNYLVVGGLNRGSTTLKLQSSSGLNVGDLVRFSTRAIGGLLVPSYRTVQQISSNHAVIDAPLPYRYPNPTYLQKISLVGAFALRNGIIEGRNWLKPNAIVFVGGYAKVTIDNLAVAHCNGLESNWIVPQSNRFVRVTNSRFIDNRIKVSGQSINVWDTEEATITGNEIRGDGFGIAVVRSDHALVQDNVLQGDAVNHPKTSVRGIKLMGCLGSTIRANKISNYANAIKAEDSGQLLIEENVCLDASPGDLTSYAIGVSNQHPDRERQGGHRILRNRIIGSGGSGIYLGPGSPHCVIEDNEISRVGSIGIAVFTDRPADHEIRRNTIRDFDLDNRGAAGVYLGANAICEDNSISDASGRKPAISLGNKSEGSIIRNNKTRENY